MRQRVHIDHPRHDWFDVETRGNQFRFMLDSRWFDVFPWETLKLAIERVLTPADLDTLDQFIDSYLVAMAFTGSDPDGEPIVHHPGGDIRDVVCGADVATWLNSDQLQTIVADCTTFLRHTCGLLGDDPELIESAAADFHFTRNGHGVGFWDGDWPEHGDTLTAISKRFGTLELYRYGDEFDLL